MTKTLSALATLSVAVSAAATPSASPPANAASAVRTSEVAERGLVGTLYLPKAEPAASIAPVLVLGGSEGGLKGGMPAAARHLAENGFMTLHLAYFALPGLPSDLELVPIEYLQRGVSWLQAQPGVSRDWLAIVGVSKGAEAALVLATLDTRIKAVVAGAPSSYVWPGLNACDSGHSSWSYRGKGLPALPCGTGPSVTDAFSAYSQGLERRHNFPEAAIRIQDSSASVLLVCGGKDTMNPACEMSSHLLHRRRSDTSITLLAYPDAGHLGFGVPVPATNPNFSRLGSLGGSAEANAAARADSWPQALRFLKSSFAARPSK